MLLAELITQDLPYLLRQNDDPVELNCAETSIEHESLHFNVHWVGTDTSLKVVDLI